MIFLFKWTREAAGARAEAPIDGTYDETATDNNVFFAAQTIQNACGTQAILSVILNHDNPPNLFRLFPSVPNSPLSRTLQLVSLPSSVVRPSPTRRVSVQHTIPLQSLARLRMRRRDRRMKRGVMSTISSRIPLSMEHCMNWMACNLIQSVTDHVPRTRSPRP